MPFWQKRPCLFYCKTHPNRAISTTYLYRHNSISTPGSALSTPSWATVSKMLGEGEGRCPALCDCCHVSGESGHGEGCWEEDPGGGRRHYNTPSFVLTVFVIPLWVGARTGAGTRQGPAPPALIFITIFAARRTQRQPNLLNCLMQQLNWSAGTRNKTRMKLDSSWWDKWIVGSN